MDLRIKRTRQNIQHAFLELRKQKPLEKISVKELSELAFINKATFYTHYHDIFDLADQMENEFFERIFEEVPYLEYVLDKPSIAVTELTKVLVREQKLADIIFSGSRAGYYSQKLNITLRKILDNKYPEKTNDLQWNVILTILIQGCYHAVQTYSKSYSLEEVTEIIGKVNDTLCEQFL